MRSAESQGIDLDARRHVESQQPIGERPISDRKQPVAVDFDLSLPLGSGDRDLPTPPLLPQDRAIRSQ